MRTTRVYIIDEHSAVRDALAECLNQSAEVEVVGHSDEANGAIVAVQECAPDVVLVETKRSDGMGLEILRQIASLTPCPFLAVLTSYPSDWEKEAAYRAGARDYLLKNIDTDELVRRIASFTGT